MRRLWHSCDGGEGLEGEGEDVLIEGRVGRGVIGVLVKVV